MILDVFLEGRTKETTPVTLTESDLSELHAALRPGRSPTGSARAWSGSSSS